MTSFDSSQSSSSIHEKSPSRPVVVQQPSPSLRPPPRDDGASQIGTNSAGSFPSFILPTRPRLPTEPPLNTNTSSSTTTPSIISHNSSNLAQLILKQKETRDYKKNSHPKAFFIKPGSGPSEKPLVTATSSQIVRSPADFDFPPLSLDTSNSHHVHCASHLTPVGILRSQQYHTSSSTHDPPADATTTTAPQLMQHSNNPSPALFSAGSPHNICSTDSDTQAQLAWLGYHQELRRDWDFWSSLSLSTLNIGTIPGAFLGILTAMEWGGPCVIFWGYILGMIIVLCLSAVVAEIASAYPVAGAMLTW